MSGEEKRRVRGMCNDGNRREQSVFPTLHYVRLSSISPSQYIRLNCIYAEKCGRMIYVRGFNTVAHTVRYCYRISCFSRRMTIICGKLLIPSSFAFFFFSYFPFVKPGAALNSHVVAEEISYTAALHTRIYFRQTRNLSQNLPVHKLANEKLKFLHGQMWDNKTDRAKFS